jgi:TM2 domain-containing membrane protein YozV
MSYSNPGATYRAVGGPRPPKYVLTAYLLAIFFGFIGLHRFYLGLYKLAIGYVGLTVVGVGLLAVDSNAVRIIGALLVLVVFVAWVRDLFIMKRLVDEANAGGTPATTE